ncbi:DUF6361 family protein [Pseudomonas wadenswilerensis]
MPRTTRSSSSDASPGIDPALGWTYLSREMLARAKAQMDNESTGVRDELGFLTIHQRYADLFFPGTSVLHGRARYALFVPWLFEDLAGASEKLQARELDLAGRLKASGDGPVIGGNVYPNPVSQPPSTVYWSALARWGILRCPGDRTPTRAQVHRLLQRQRSRLDDDGQPLLAYEPPFLALPVRPEGWPQGPIDLRLTRAEAEFLYQRLANLTLGNSTELSLLSRLVRTRTAAPDSMWAEETRAVAGNLEPLLERARQAASLAGLGRAVYDTQLEHLLHEHDNGKASCIRSNHLLDMLAKHRDTAAGLDVDALERDIGSLPGALRDVVSATREWLANGKSDPLLLLDTYTRAEARKGTRARLAMTRDGRSRRLAWEGDSSSLAEPLHFRWRNVRWLLNDLAHAS